MHFVIHAEMPAKNVFVAAIAAHPVVVAEDQHRISAARIVGRGKEPAEIGLDSKQIKEMSRNNAGAHLVRLLPIKQDKRHLVVLLNLRQRLGLLAIILNLLH
jgi:hypothetical protein